MKRSFATLILAAVALAVPAYAQDTSSQLVGVWKYVSQFNAEVQSGKVTKNYGDNPSGYIIYIKGGRFTFVLFAEGRQKPALPMKDEDRVKLFNSLAVEVRRSRRRATRSPPVTTLRGTSSGPGHLRSARSRSKATL
jgi:hypothetical protein